MESKVFKVAVYGMTQESADLFADKILAAAEGRGPTPRGHADTVAIIKEKIASGITVEVAGQAAGITGRRPAQVTFDDALLEKEEADHCNKEYRKDERSK